MSDTIPFKSLDQKIEEAIDKRASLPPDREIVCCADCDTVMWLEKDFIKRRRADHKGFYCQFGHANHFPEKE